MTAKFLSIKDAKNAEKSLDSDFMGQGTHLAMICADAVGSLQNPPGRPLRLGGSRMLAPARPVFSGACPGEVQESKNSCRMPARRHPVSLSLRGLRHLAPPLHSDLLDEIVKEPGLMAKELLHFFEVVL